MAGEGLKATLIVALDLPSFDQAQNWVKRLGKSVDFYKVGFELFVQEGPKVLEFLKNQKKRIFLDLKFHDIPNTVAKAVRSACNFEVDLLSIHASGGSQMLEAAVVAAKKTDPIARCKIFAVTVLTSLSDLRFVGSSETSEESVIRLAKMAEKAGVDGIICSPQEIQSLRKHLLPTLQILTPGIRFEAEEIPDQNQIPQKRDDQTRTATPAEAVRAGANYLVVGRPILTSADPCSVVARLLEDL